MNEKIAFKVAAELLSMAADEFGNHGCNDLKLTDLKLTRDEQIALVTYMNEQNGSPEETPDDIKRLPYTADFAVMGALAGYFRDRSK